MFRTLYDTDALRMLYASGQSMHKINYKINETVVLQSKNLIQIYKFNYF